MTKRTRNDEMREQAAAFHAANPEVWEMFVKFTFQMIERGWTHYSAQNGVFARIRWETDLARGGGDAQFKINNNHAAFYSRRFMRMYPKYDGFFHTRHQTSNDEPPVDLPPLTPADFPTYPQGAVMVAP